MKTGMAMMMVAAAAYGQVSLELTPRGAIGGIDVSGKRVTGPLSFYVPGPGWQSRLISSDSLSEVRTGREGFTQTLRGVATSDAGALADVQITVNSREEGIDVVMECTPRQDVAAQDSLMRLMLPIEAFSGKNYLLQAGANSREGSFPEKLPKPYAFISEAGFDCLALSLGEDRFLVLEPDWKTVQRVNVQDNRQFNADDYEIQMYLRDGRRLSAGKTLRGHLKLHLAEGARLRAEMEKDLVFRRRLKEALHQDAPAAILAVSRGAETVPAYGLLELEVDLAAKYENPFDPEDICLEARIIAPDGHEITVPGFFYCPYERNRTGLAERLTPVDGAGWRIRFCPRQAGAYRGRVLLTDGDAQVEEPFTFSVVPSEDPGMIRVAKGNPLYLEFENGTPYFAIGENVCWPGAGGTYDYDNYWQRLGENGANYARLWIGPFDCFTLERVARGPDDHAGLGRIDLEGAWRVDYVLDEAAKHGIRIMFCIDSFNSLRIREPYAIWSRCPYNQANGGPLADPKEFFTNDEAKKLFRRRLRYIAARWGHLPTVLSWEFWNEVNIIETYVSADSVAWHREMARYLREIDPCDHLITTSWAGTEGDSAVDALPEMDYIQSHQYGAPDAARLMIDVCLKKKETFAKPHYFGEFGTGTRAEGTLEDVDGIHLHNGLWSGIFGNAMGTAMLWWWDNYVEPRDLYHLFTPIAGFVEGVPFNTAHYSPPASLSVTWRGIAPPPRQENLFVQGSHASWSPAPFNRPCTLVCGIDGAVEGIAQLSRLQHGTVNHPDLHNPVTFQVNYLTPGRFAVRVNKVSGYGGAGLTIRLDGEIRLDKLFPDTDDHNRDIVEFNGEYAIEVPAGTHTIVVENPGRDWVFLDYLLPGYARKSAPPVDARALVAPDAPVGQPAVLVWARHEAFNWYRHSLGMTEWTVAPVEVIVEGVPAGRYTVELWNTLTGEVRSGEPVLVENGTVQIPLPAFDKSIAVRLVSVAEK